MADEFAAMAPTEYKIELLGINWSTSNFNPLMTQGRDLPWLQDDSGGVTASWGAGYRDFVILDPANGRPVAAYNLTSNNLGIAANYEELKAILLGLAEFRDGDGDGLSDFWEEEMFEGSLAPDPSDDNDQDGAPESLEYGLGSRADSEASLPVPGATTIEMGGERYPAVSYRRRLGASPGLAYFIEIANGLAGWSDATSELVEVQVVNPYDGTGTEIVTLRSTMPISANPAAQLRVRVTLP